MPAQLTVERPAPATASLVLDRPERHNAIDLALVDALGDALAAAADQRTVILQSSVAGVFCGGVDRRVDDATRQVISDRLYALYERIRMSEQIVIAALDGPAVGGGAQLALVADLRFAGPRASLRFMGPGHGLAVGAWGLPALVGRGRALELCLSMRTVDAEEARRAGLVERLVPDPVSEATAFGRALATLDRAAVARAKRVVRLAAGDAAALEAERAGNAATWNGSLHVAGE